MGLVVNVAPRMKNYLGLLKFLVGAAAVVAILGYIISIFWPYYDFGWSVSSPDSKYVAVVLRGNAAAFDDFSYKVYILPQSDAPQGMKQGDGVLMLGKWRGSRYLVYSGYGYPELHWQTSRKIEIAINDLYPDVGVFHPTKRLTDNATILVSLVFDKSSPEAATP